MWSWTSSLWSPKAWCGWVGWVGGMEREREGCVFLLVFRSKFLSIPNCFDTHTSLPSEHGLFVWCRGCTTTYRWPFHHKSRDVRFDRCVMSIVRCWFTFLVFVYPVPIEQESSPRRRRCWRRWQTVACVASFQACYVLFGFTDSLWCLSKLLRDVLRVVAWSIRNGWRGSRREPRPHRYAHLMSFWYSPVLFCWFWIGVQETSRLVSGFVKSPALVRFTLHVNEHGEMTITDLPELVTEGGPAIPWSCLSLYCRFLDWKIDGCWWTDRVSIGELLA